MNTIVRSASVLTNSTFFSTMKAKGRGSRETTKADLLGPTVRRCGQWLFEGRFRKTTLGIVSLPHKQLWKIINIVFIIYKYIFNMLYNYYFDEYYWFLDVFLYTAEIIFTADVALNLLHALWPEIRFRIRAYRMPWFFLALDVLTLMPVSFIYIIFATNEEILSAGRWLSIIRIYKLYGFFEEHNRAIRKSRLMLFLIEHVVSLLLVIHGFSCMWYELMRPWPRTRSWYNISFPSHVSLRKLSFNRYEECWYYCACRLLQVLFGDCFPMTSLEKWLTTAMMLTGFIFFRYRFIGYLTLEMMTCNRRWFLFSEQYNYMLKFLSQCGASETLVEQANNFKRQLWYMKDGVVASSELSKLPNSLKMEIIFDINVRCFQSSLLFRNSSEAFLRQISLLMQHKLYLAGEQIWSQGVIKNGMIYVKRGVLEMLSDEDDESPMIAFKKGTVLGEISLFYSIPSKVTVKAATYVELQVLNRNDLMRVINENPMILREIRGQVSKRLNDAIKKQKAIENYEKDDSRLIRARFRPMKSLKDHLAGVEEEDPTFVDDSYMYYRDENNKRQPKFITTYLELYKYSPSITTIESPRICLNTNFPWILEPDTDFTLIFNLMHFAFILYSCIVFPGYAIRAIRPSDILKVLDVIILSGLILNIYIQLTTCIVDKSGIKDTVQKITEVKLSSFCFYIDVISVLPVYIFSEVLDPQNESIWPNIARLLPVLQVWHLWDYIYKWEHSFNSIVSVKFLCVLKYGLLLTIFCFWSGCFLYAYSCPRSRCRKDSWMSQLIYLETKVFAIINARHIYPVLTAISFGTSVFTGSGISELSPGVLDILFVTTLLTIGAYFSFFYTAKIISLYILTSLRRLKFQGSMRELFYFLKVNRVSDKITARVKQFFCVQWYYNNAVSTNEIFKDMSSNIQSELLSIAMVETLISCPIFQECSQDFLQIVASRTTTIVLPQDEIVQHLADISRDMYILQKGHCKVLDHNGKLIMSVGPGSSIGVLEMLVGLPKVYMIVTTTNCVFCHIEYSALMQLWSAFPDVSQTITNALQDSEIISRVKQFEEAKPIVGRLDVKTNRLAQEIKESFVWLKGRTQRIHYINAFNKLGIMRHIRYFFVPACITPYGLFLKFWCVFRLVLALYYVLTIPYFLATKQSKFGGDPDRMDFILYIDILIMSYVAYYDEKSLLITHPLLTVTNYLSTNFLWDFIAIFPLERLLLFIIKNVDADLCRLNRLLLISRISGMFTYWEQDIMRVSPLVVLLKFLPLTVTIVNILTSVVFMNSCIPYIVPNSNLVLANCTREMSEDRVKMESVVAMHEYFHVMVWIFEVFTGCTCIPVIKTSKNIVILVIIVQISGYLYFAFMFGYVASEHFETRQTLLEHTENTRDMENFLYQENVDPILTARTMKYFDYVWKRTNGSNPQHICRRLNSALMEDTLIFIYEHALKEVPLFAKVERSFIKVFTQHLNEMYFIKGETVVQSLDIQDSVFIIYQGKVDVMNSYNEMITCMGPGGMFGNFTGHPISCSEVSIIASRNLDLLVIPSQAFFNLVKFYPKIKDPLQKAFEKSKDYILPITLNVENDSLSDDSNSLLSIQDSEYSSRLADFDLMTAEMSSRSSRYSFSRSSKSSISLGTTHNFSHWSNVVKPGSFFFQGFGYISCLMVTLNSVVILYEMVTLNNCLYILWLQTFFDVFFYCQIVIYMHQGYMNKRGFYIHNSIKCRNRYFKNKMLMWSDIFANFPLDILTFLVPMIPCRSDQGSRTVLIVLYVVIFSSSGVVYENVECPMYISEGLSYNFEYFTVIDLQLKVLHLLRFNKLFRLKYVVQFYQSTSAELTNNQTTLQLFMTGLVMVLSMHIFTCIWLLLLIAYTPVCKARTIKLILIDRVTAYRQWDYTTAIYVVLSKLTSAGGDEYLMTLTPILTILVLGLIVGKTLASLQVASVVQVAYAKKCTLNKYENKQLKLLDFLNNQGLSKFQSQKLIIYIRQLWMTERGRQLPLLLSKAPYVRRCDLMSAMFGHHLRNCYLFAETSEAFLRQLTVVLEYTVYFPGNYIVSNGNCDARMFWVASGSVSVVSVRPDLTEILHEVLKQGDMFGVRQGLNRGVRHWFSYRAETKVSILALDLDAWSHILPFFPEAEHTIRERADVLFAHYICTEL